MKNEKMQYVFLRLPQVLKIFPVSKSSWWQGCKEGRFPKPIKPGPRTKAWRKSDMERLAEEVSSAAETLEKNV